MEKKTIIVDVNTDDGVKSLNRLEASFEDVYGEVQPLTGRIGELEDQLYEMASAGQQGTQEFTQLAAQIGKMKKVIVDVDMAVDGMSGTMSQKLGGSIQGLSGGFELAQGVMGAFGAESAKVEEALLKVNSAMAIAQGVQSVRESIPAFKALGSVIAQTTVGQKLLNVAQIAGAAAMRVINTVMAANPIGLVVTAVAGLSAAFYALTQRTDKAALAQKELQRQLKLTKKLSKESQDNLTKNWDANNIKTQQAIDLMKAKGATDKEVYIAEKDFIDQQLRQMDVQRMSGTKLTTEQYANYQQLTNDKKILDAEYQSFLADKLQESNEKVKESIEKRKAAENDATNERKQKEKEAAEAIIAEQKKIYDESVRLNAERIASEDAQFKLEQELTNTAQEQELAQLVEAYDAKYLIAADNAELELLLAAQFKIDQAAIDEKYRKEKEAKDKESADKAKALKKEQIDAELNMAKTALGTLGEIADLFAGDSERSQKKAFNIKKAAAIATTTIETYQAAQSAYASQMAITTPDAPIRAAIAAGIAIAQGLVRVASISKTKFKGGGSVASSGGGGGGGGSVPSASTPANFNIVGNSNTNQLMEGLQNNPVKTYVVSGDVTSAQSLDRNQIKTATL
jgi:hypothetical protein